MNGKNDKTLSVSEIAALATKIAEIVEKEAGMHQRQVMDIASNLLFRRRGESKSN